MIKKSLFIWFLLLIFGFTSMPEVGSANVSKQTGKTELTKKKKKSKKKSSKKKVSKKKKNSKKKSKRSAGKKKNSKNKKHSKNKKSSRKKSKKRNSYTRKHYSPPTNNNNVEYRNYKRNPESDNNQDIEKIAPQKEIRKEPKKEGDQ
jgi:hypothetical protein